MVHEVLSNYNLIQGKLEFQPVMNGLINQTWLIKNFDKKFILQKINHRIFKKPEDIAHNVRLIADYLLLNNPAYLFIAPLKTNNNQEMNFLKEKGYFRLFPFVEKSHTINAVEMPQQAFEAARKFGEFTKLLAKFPAKKLHVTLPDFHNLTLRYQQFSNALEDGNKDRLLQSNVLINFIQANKNIVNTYEKILHDPFFKLRVTHHDTKISNVLFNDEDKGLCVIDLDTVMPGYFFSDVGDMIRTYLSPANEEEKDFSKIKIRDHYFKAIWDGYMKEMKDELSEVEKSHFIYAGKFMIYMQAIRFLTDHLNNDIYYGARYENHNLVRAGNQIILLQLLITKEEELERLIK